MYVYLHGFNSSGASAKGAYLAKALAPETVLTPSYPPDPDHAIQALNQLLDGLGDTVPILIGSSLGGYYAQYLSQQRQLPAVLVNPALEPRQTLAPYLGWQTNYYTGECYWFGQAQLDALARYAVSEPCTGSAARLVLLDRGDELIDYRVAAAHYAGCAELIIYPDGNHQFAHMPEAALAIRTFREKLRSKPQI